MNTGHLQRRWSENRPQVYDKETRLVCLDIIEEKRADMDGKEKYGFSYFQVEIDRQFDYGHVKSQLIEAGFAQKDEFGLLMNATEGIIGAVASSASWAKFKEALEANEDINAFTEFCAFRKECATAAKEVMECYK